MLIVDWKIHKVVLMQWKTSRALEEGNEDDLYVSYLPRPSYLADDPALDISNRYLSWYLAYRDAVVPILPSCCGFAAGPSHVIDNHHVPAVIVGTGEPLHHWELGGVRTAESLSGRQKGGEAPSCSFFGRQARCFIEPSAPPMVSIRRCEAHRLRRSTEQRSTATTRSRSTITATRSLHQHETNYEGCGPIRFQKDQASSSAILQI